MRAPAVRIDAVTSVISPIILLSFVTPDILSNY